MFREVLQIVKVRQQPGKQLPVKLHARGENIPRANLKSDFTMKGNMIVLEPKPVSKDGGKLPQKTVLPPIGKCPSRPQVGVLPPISKGPQKSTPWQQTMLPPTKCKQQQRKGLPLRKTFSKESSDSKEAWPFGPPPVVETEALSPETVLRYSKKYLTEHELEEIKDYPQVWYLGTRAFKNRDSKPAETQDIKSFNSGYDTEDGFYKVILRDHLAYRFEVLKELGIGFSGQVLKCLDYKTMEVVAIKVIRNKDSVHQLGLSEVKMLETLQALDKDNRANIVHMKEHFYFRNHLCITFQLFEKDLYEALTEKKQGGFDESEVRKYATDVLKCLQLLRKKGIIHGDIKPDNMLLHDKNNDMHVAVGDFGGSYFAKTRDQPFTHTLYYASPETLLGKRCNPATDMWSLGCVLAELYLGRVLFGGKNIVDQFNCIMKVLGLPPVETLANSPKGNYYFDSSFIPLDAEDIKQNSTSLDQQLNAKNSYFLDFIKRCLEYDPMKRLTPEEALQHPWIHGKQQKPQPGGTTSGASVSCSSNRPGLLRRAKISPMRLQPRKGGGHIKAPHEGH